MVKEEMGQEKGIPDQDISQLDVNELTTEQKRELIIKALEQGKEEASLILTLKEWSRPGHDFDDYGEIKLIHGEVEKILLDHDYDYPTRNDFLYAIIPKTRSVVILFESGDDYQGKLTTHQSIYVFDYKHGWRLLNLY